MVGEPHVHAVFIDETKALDQAAKCHGIVKALVLEDGVLALVMASHANGVEQGKLMRGGKR
jgi:hypothetical protein